MNAPAEIARVPRPSHKDFFENYLYKSKPVVITGLVDEWPAFRKWDLNYFDENFNDLVAGTITLKNGTCDLNIEQGSKLKLNTLGETLASIRKQKLDNGSVLAAPIDDFKGKLLDDFSAPEFCANGKFLRSRIFVGPKGVITSLHQDLPENLYVMVKGKKRITLFPPSSPVYPNPRFSKLPNHSQVDIENPDYEKFPLLRGATPYVVDLCAGETLFIPSFWWHHLHNLDTCFAINFWWSYGWKLPIAWLAAMYKKTRGI